MTTILRTELSVVGATLMLFNFWSDTNMTADDAVAEFKTQFEGILG